MHGESPLPDAEVRFAEDAADVSPHISAAAEPLGHFGPFTFTNSMLMMFITMAVLLIMAWLAARRIRQDPEAALVPQGLQNLAEAVIEFLDDLVQSMVGGRYARHLLPIGGTFFIFIAVANWFSLLPGIGTIWLRVEHQGHLIAAPIFRPATADINMTLALALVAFLVIHVSGITAHGPLGAHQGDVSGPAAGAVCLSSLSCSSSFRCPSGSSATCLPERWCSTDRCWRGSRWGTSP